MTTLNLNSSNNNQTFNLTSTSLNPETVNVTTSTALMPTVNINATLVSGAFNVNVTAGATVDLDEVAAALGTFHLTANGGTIVANAGIGVAVSNDVTIEGGGTFVVGASFLGLLNNTAIDFGVDNSSTDTLVIDNNGGLLNLSFTSPIAGFTGVHQVINDKLISGADVAKYVISQSGAGSPQTLTFENSAGQSLGSLTFAAGTFSGADLGTHVISGGPLHLVTAADGSLTTSIACYLAGTCILTSQGQAAVEALRIGDLVVTGSGEERPIKWIGTRSYSARFARNNIEVHPVCFTAGSLGENVPFADLWVSPKHAMLLDGALIPSELLVNGVTILQPLPTNDVHYFHIELESHDVLVANGAASESFIDDGSRAMFHNAATYSAMYSVQTRQIVRYCAPRVENGFALDRVRRRLAERAGLPVAKPLDVGGLDGEIEEIDVDGVRGWARNTAFPDAAVCLDVFMGGEWIGYAYANRPREGGGRKFSLRFRAPIDLNRALTLKMTRSIDGTPLRSLVA